MKIEVKQKHIRAGVKCSINYCPIALALSDCTGLIFSVGEMSIEHGDFSIDTPKRCERFIEAFDDEENVKPFSFNLPIDKYVNGWKKNLKKKK